MTPHVWYVAAFILLAAATVKLATDKAWDMVLVTAGLACWVLPVAFQLTS